MRNAFAIFLLLFSWCAHADWVNPSVSYLCDGKHQRFSLVGVVETDNEGVVEIQNGFHHMPRSDNVLKCKIGKSQVVAKFQLLPARERGQCSAFDSYDLVSLVVDGKLLFSHTLFNNVCEMSEPSPYAIEISANARTLVQKECRGKWDWTKGYKDGACKERPLH